MKKKIKYLQKEKSPLRMVWMNCGMFLDYYKQIEYYNSKSAYKILKMMNNFKVL